jgi:photosystem I P700 chlorophyll a apoprotein A1
MVFEEMLYQVIFSYINRTQWQVASSRVWSFVGHFNKALSKGPKAASTTWIYNLHADAHDFRTLKSSSSSTSRIVFSSNLAHLSLVFLWIASMHFHGA